MLFNLPPTKTLAKSALRRSRNVPLSLILLISLIVTVHCAAEANAVLTVSTSTQAIVTNCPAQVTTSSAPDDTGNPAPGPSWTVTSTQGEPGGSSSGTTNGWLVQLNQQSVDLNEIPFLEITTPVGATGNYTVVYATYAVKNNSLVTTGYTVKAVVPSNSAALRPGAAYPYEASLAGVNLMNGNKMTSVPLFSWKTLSGQTVGVTLTHNSQGSAVSTIGNGWLQTYDATLLLSSTSSPATATVTWGDGTFYTETVTNGTDTHSLSTPSYHDKVAPSSGGNGAYTLTTQNDQTVYTFAPAGNSHTATTQLYLYNITDRYGYTITITRNSSNLITSVADSRTNKIAYGYTGSYITSITDPLGRVWQLTQDGSNNLTKITYPTVNENGVIASAPLTFTYSNNCIATATSLNGNTTGPLVYNSSRGLTSATDAAGKSTTTFTYNPSSTVVKDANNNQTTYSFAESRLASVTDPTSASESFAYDYDNNVMTTTSKRGYNSGSSDDLNGQETQSYDANNVNVSSIYDANNSNLLSSTDTAGTTSYSYTAGTGMHLLSVYDPMSLTTSYTYYPADSNGTAAAYQIHDLPDTVVDPQAAAKSYTTATYSYGFSTDGSGSYTVSVEDANGNSTSISYNRMGWPTSATDGAGHKTSFTYDERGRLIATSYPNGTVSRKWYDADGNVLAAADPNATEGSLKGSVAWGTDGPFTGGCLSLNGTNASVIFNNPLPSVNASFPSSSGIGSLTGGSSVGGGTGAEDQFGTTQYITLSAWVKSSSSYGSSIANVIDQSVSGGNENFLRYYDGQYQVGSYNGSTVYAAAYSVPSGDTGTWVFLTGTYDGSKWNLYRNGTLVAQASASFGALNAIAPWAVGSDSAGSTRFFGGEVTQVKLFNRALSASEVSALYAVNEYTVNPASDVTNGLAHYWALNEGNGASMAIDSAHTTWNNYDADDRLIETWNGRRDAVKYAYDAGSDPRSGNSQTQYGLLSSTTDGNGHVTKYGYSVRNELTYTLYADSSFASASFDADGNVSTTTDANGNTTSYVYDPGDRLTNTNYPSSPAYSILATPSVAYSYYSGLNWLQQMAETLGSTTTDTTWFYDNDGRVVGLSNPQLGGSSTTASQAGLVYAYDAASRKTSTSLPVAGSGTVWSYAYDNGNRLTSVTSPYGVGGTNGSVTSLSYNDDNTLNVRTAQNGTTTHYVYDDADQVEQVYTDNSAGSATLEASSYTYDSAGNPVTQVRYADVGNAANPQTDYTYDGTDELTEEIDSTTATAFPVAYAELYTYDHNENRLSKYYTNYGSSTWTQQYAYNSIDELTGVTGDPSGTYAFGYDKDGNTTSVSVGGTAEYAYAYDMANRLRGVSGSGIGSNPTSYAYNASGSLLSATCGGATYTQRNDGVSATSPLLWDGSVLHTPGGFSEDDAGYHYYYQPDLLGSSVGVMTAAGAQQTVYEYDGFGLVQGMDGTAPGSHPLQDGFAGGAGYQEQAGTGGLVRCGNRFYNPQFGRFVTEDPAAAGTNWYAYCANDPVTRIDPKGEEWQGDQWVPDSSDPSGCDPNSGSTTGFTDGSIFTDSTGWQEQLQNGAWVPYNNGSSSGGLTFGDGAGIGLGTGAALVYLYNKFKVRSLQKITVQNQTQLQELRTNADGSKIALQEQTQQTITGTAESAEVTDGAEIVGGSVLEGSGETLAVGSGPVGWVIGGGTLLTIGAYNLSNDYIAPEVVNWIYGGN